MENPIQNPSPKPIPPASNTMPPVTQPQPAQGTSPVQITPEQPASSNLSAGVIVLGWLTYAFWGWTVLALSFLTGMLISYYFNQTNAGDLSAYVIAAVLVLLPISLVCDYFYTKQEPAKKTGAALAVMVIHAVIFALFAIGSLITAAWSIVSIFLNASRSDNSDTMTILASALIIMIFYLLTFLRTLNPAKFSFIPKVYKITMGVLVGLICILTIAGPVVGQRATRNDKLIESGLVGVSSGINDYTNRNGRLPNALSDVTLTGDSKQLVEQNLVEYKPNTTDSPQSSTSTYGSYKPTRAVQTYYYYQLCVTYKAKQGTGESDSNDRYSYTSGVNSDYATYPRTYDHPAGNVCYKLNIYGKNY